MRAIICILFCFLISINGICQLSPEQEKVVDSLKSIIKIAGHDTLKINAYKAWDNLIYNFDSKLDEELNRKIIGLSESNLTSSKEQKQKLKKVFNDWKGNLEQVDDVCIIGIRI